MSPAQLHRHPAKEGYVGTAVDVWAAGVLLSVMLLGALYPVRCDVHAVTQYAEYAVPSG